MSLRTVTLTLTVEAKTTEEAADIANGAAQHLLDTYNDNESIKNPIPWTVEPVGDPWHLFLVEDGDQQRLMSAQSGSEAKAEELVTASAIDEHGFDAEFTGARYLGIVSGPYEGDVDEALNVSNRA